MAIACPAQFRLASVMVKSSKERTIMPRIATLALAVACLATVLGSTDYMYTPMEQAFREVAEDTKHRRSKVNPEDIEKIKIKSLRRPRDAPSQLQEFKDPFVAPDWEPSRQSKIGGGLVKWESVSRRESERKVLAKVDRDFILASAGSIASYRAAVTNLNSEYLCDPYARVFARHVCHERLEEVLKKPAVQLSRFAVRTRFFDGFVKDAMHKRGIQQVVIIGAGFDARAIRPLDMRFVEIPQKEKPVPGTDPNLFKEDRGLCFYELDLPEMINAKKAILGQFEHQKEKEEREFEKEQNMPKVYRIGADVMHDDWLLNLRLHGFDPTEPACFLLEGFLYYFDEASVRRTLRAITALSAPGSRIGMSAVSRAATASANKTSRFVWGTDQPEHFIEGFGWEGANAFQFGDPSIAFGWELPQESVDAAQISRNDTSQKRTWYVIATRSHPPKKLWQKIVEPIVRFRDAISPWVHRFAPWVVDVMKNGVRVPIPVPRWLDPDVD